MESRSIAVSSRYGAVGVPRNRTNFSPPANRALLGAGQGKTVKFKYMDDSLARPRAELASLDLPGWKSAVSWLAAALLAVFFAVSGIWKITYPLDWAVRISELKFPEHLSLAFALALGIAETTGALMILAPRFRRVGAAIIGLLLAAFLLYFAVNYSALRGADCTCFPWVKRVVGPGFFLGDAAMLALAVMAGIWAKPVHGLRGAALILGVVVVYALVSYGVAAVRQTGTLAPAAVEVNGAPYSLRDGRILVFFFDPECEHCFKAAQKMSKLDWGTTKVVAVPVSTPRFAPMFLKETGLKAGLSSDLEKLKAAFPYTATPAAVALEFGREKAALTQFESDAEPAATLRQLGFVK
jgi:uncharacterized membrane protein